MAKHSAAEIRERLLGKIRDIRLAAVPDAAALPKKLACALLREGMAHWDRDVRRMCAKELYGISGSRVIPELLRMHDCGLLSPRATAWILSTRPTPRLIDTAVKESADREHPVFSPFLERLATHPRVEYWRKKEELARRREFVARERRLEAQRKQEKRAQERARAKAEAAARRRAEILDYPAIAAIFPERRPLLDATFGEWRRDRECFSTKYRRSEISKRSGGTREILAPERPLKTLQRLFVDSFLAAQKLHPACHGFRAGRSTKTGAEPHTGHAVVVNIDLRDFFPSITAGRVAGAFVQLNVPGGHAGRSFLVDLVTCDGRLPQGAPTSPAIANLVCRRMDRRLAGLMKKAKCAYTRYADDLSFSGPRELLGYLPLVRSIIVEEGFAIAHEKTRVLRRGVRQEVTGLTVNDTVSVPRAIRRRLRAAVHATATGRTPTWKGKALSLAALRGHIAYLQGMHPIEATQLARRLPTGRAGARDAS